MSSFESWLSSSLMHACTLCQPLLSVFSQSTSHEAHPVAETHCCNQEILRRGGIILFCDFVVSNMLDMYMCTRLHYLCPCK